MKKIYIVIIILVIGISVAYRIYLKKENEDNNKGNLNYSSIITMYIKHIGESDYKQIFQVPKDGNFIITTSCNNMAVEWNNDTHELKNKIKSFPSSCVVKFEEK